MAAMRDMPDVTGNIMSIGAGHLPSHPLSYWSNWFYTARGQTTVRDQFRRPGTARGQKSLVKCAALHTTRPD